MAVHSKQLDVILHTINPSPIAAGAIVEEAFTVPGVRPTDAVVVNKPTTTVGLFIFQSKVISSGQVVIPFFNSTGGMIDPPEEEYIFVIFRT